MFFLKKGYVDLLREMQGFRLVSHLSICIAVLSYLWENHSDMKIHFLSLLILLFPASIFACSCVYSTNFCETMTPSSNVAGVRVLQTYLVDDGLILQYVDVVVLDKLQGTIPADTLSLLVSDGTSCTGSPNLSEYLVGDRMFILAEYALGIGPNSFPAFHVKPPCSQFMIFADKGIGTVGYEGFKESFNDCVLTTKTFGRKELERFINFYPNPVSTNLMIGASIALNLSIDIYAADGRKVLEVDMRQMLQLPVDVTNWASGVYYVRIGSDETWVTKKFVKI